MFSYGKMEEIREVKMSEVTKKAKNRSAGAICAAVVILVLVVGLVLVFLMNRTETRTWHDETTTTTGSLVCTNASPANAFFKHDDEVSAEHKIKVTFKGDQFDKLNYTYTGEFESNEEATSALSEMHADYNIYMGENGLDQEALYATFSPMENEGVINLYISRDDFNSATAKFVFLSNGEFKKMGKYSAEEVQKVYKNKGFTCQLSE